MAKRTSKYQPYERYIFSALRKVFGWTKKKDALAKGRVGVNKYKCAKCDQIFSIDKIHVDHIIPVMNVTGWDGDWSGYIKRLFHGETQLLCKPHHQEKTNAERKVRKTNEKT